MKTILKIMVWLNACMLLFLGLNGYAQMQSTENKAEKTEQSVVKKGQKKQQKLDKFKPTETIKASQSVDFPIDI